VKPTIGRIVLFCLPPAYWQYVAENDRIRPAIVTSAPADSALINVRVIYDPTDVFMVSVADQVNLLEGAGTAGRWSWPERSA
jgi:hypothetical protein